MGEASRKNEGLPVYRYRWLPPLLLALLVNANVLLNGFAWDDKMFFVDPSHPAWNIDGPGLAPMVYDRPLIGWSYRLDQWIWGLNPFGAHLSVYLAHALTTLLVYGSVRRLIRLYRQEEWIALLAASLFAVHPIHAEAVAWISGRNDVFMALFMMAALYAYLRYRQGAATSVTLPLFILGCGLALLSKETAIPFLLIFPVFDLLFHRSGVIMTKGPGMKDPFTWVWVGGLGSFILYRLAHTGIPLPHLDGLSSLGNGITTLLIALGYYLKLLFIPYPLNLYVAELPAGNAHGLLYLLIGIGGLLVLFWVLFRWNRTLRAVGAVWFVLGMVAPLVVPLVKVSATPVAERYAYLASGGFFLLLSTWVFEPRPWIWTRGGRPDTSRWALGCLVVIVGLFSYLTVQRNGVWRNEISLWEDTVRKSPGAAHTHNNLGVVYKDLGRFEEAIREFQTALKLKPDYVQAHFNLGTVYDKSRRVEEAIHEYRSALKLKPDLAWARNNLGIVYKNLGRLEEAIQEYQTELKLHPDDFRAHNNLGDVFAEQGRLKEAVQAYQTALTFEPNFAEAHNNLGTVYQDLKRFEEAIREYQAAFTLQPNYADPHYNLGNALTGQGRFEEAIQEYQTTLKLQPDYADAYNNLGEVYRQSGRLQEAMKAYQAVLRLNPTHGAAHNNLGLALAVGGRFEEAIKEYQTALNLDPDDVNAHYNLGLAYASRQRLKEAIEEYQTAIHLKPDFVKARNNLGNIYVNQGRREEALREYQAALRLDPNYADAHYNLGVVYARSGNVGEAKKHYERALQIKPDFLAARKALDVLSK